MAGISQRIDTRITTAGKQLLDWSDSIANKQTPLHLQPCRLEIEGRFVADALLGDLPNTAFPLALCRDDLKRAIGCDVDESIFWELPSSSSISIFLRLELLHENCLHQLLPTRNRTSQPRPRLPTIARLPTSADLLRSSEFSGCNSTCCPLGSHVFCFSAEPWVIDICFQYDISIGASLAVEPVLSGISSVANAGSLSCPASALRRLARTFLSSTFSKTEREQQQYNLSIWSQFSNEFSRGYFIASGCNN